MLSAPLLRALVAAAFLLCVLGLSAPAVAETPEEIFHRGNAAYQEGRYAEAAQAYETVLRYQIRDPRLEFNLGNAEFRLGRLGRAILHYERARRLDPTDPDIRANLAFARSVCFDRVEPPELPLAVQWVRAVQDRLGPDRQAWAFLALLWCIAVLLAATLSVPGRWSPAAGWTLAAMLLVAALIGASWHATYQRLEGQQLAVVLDAAVEVLAGPGENNPALFTVHEGLTLEVRSEREDWIQVSLPNGLNGWIPSRLVGRV
jgi:tetratricopeptide (TPR) repeat protein